MGAFIKTTKVCAVVALGLGLSLGIAVGADPSVAIAAAAPASQATTSSIVVTSPSEIDENTPFVIAGTAKAGTTLQVFGLPDALLTQVKVGEGGTFSHRTERGFAAGVHSVTLSAGYQDSVVLDMRVRGADGTVPALTPLSVDEPEYVPGEKLSLSGRATPGATIRVTATLANLGNDGVTVRDDGSWSFVSPTAVGGLEHDVRVRQSGPAGSDEKRLTLNADASSFKPLTVDAPSYVPGQKVRLSGTATPNGAIHVSGSTAGISENLTADPDGKWSFESRYAVSGLQHQVRVRQTAANDAGIVVKLQADASSFKPLTVDAPSYVPGQKLRLSGTATPNGAITISGSSAGISETLTAGADGKWSFESKYAVSGLQHQVRVRQTAANDAGIVAQLQAHDENGEKPVFRPIAVTSGTSYVPGGTTRLTGEATPWSQVRVALSNAGGKPIPGASSWTDTVMAGADGAWSVEIPNHRLISAKVQQYGELGNQTVTFDFTR